jgi:hypothetical protein
MQFAEAPVSSSPNRRVFERVPAEGEIKIKGKGRMGIYAVVLNLSLGGVLLSATPAMPVGSQWEVQIRNTASQKVDAVGTVVRSDAGGTALKFSKELTTSTLQALTSSKGGRGGGVLSAYMTYFQVGRNEDNAGCEQLLGVSRKTYRTVFYSTFFSCIPTAVLPVWIMRASIYPLPVWLKIVLSFGYGALWLLILQPTLDLAALQVIRRTRKNA